jgi:predicted branched-subunit amino acid permease
MTDQIRRAYWQGFRDGLPFLLVIVPFGMLFGVVAAEAGWNLAEVMGMSVLVIAGASQFTALQLMSEHAPTLIVVGTALAVNLRMAMYSAAMVPHVGAAPLWQRALVAYFLVDQTYGASMHRIALQPRMNTSEKVAHFFGNVTPVCGPWYLSSWAGAAAGAAIPDALALDFAVPITFIAIVAPALRSLPHLAAAVVSVGVALALAWMPYNLWLIPAALLAMLAGAGVELWLERRA